MNEDFQGDLCDFYVRFKFYSPMDDKTKIIIKKFEKLSYQKYIQKLLNEIGTMAFKDFIILEATLINDYDLVSNTANPHKSINKGVLPNDQQ